MVVAVRAEAVISAQNRLRPGLSSAARDLDRFRTQQTKATSAFGSASARALGAIGGALAGFSATRALNDATRRFAEVDRAMTRTGITGDATAQQTREGAVELRNLARATATLFDPAQKGLDAITASGRDFGEAMKMMPSVLRTAQASGAGVEEIANSSTALLDHMKISVDGLAAAQDTLAMGGKLGKFELKDMARYLPSMLPAFKALGQTGQDGLRSLVAMLQVIRGGTGTAEEAASSAQNIFSKLESEETVKNFKKMGVDLPSAMAKARKEGKNLLEVFVELSNKALKGDLSKVPQLFKDMEVQRGMRPLLADFQKYLDLRDKLKGSTGTIDIDFQRVASDAKANLDRFSEATDRAKTAFGGLAAELGSTRLAVGAENIDRLAQAMERAAVAVRDKGVQGAIADMAKAAGAQIASEMDDHRQNWQKIEDDATLGRIAERNKAGGRLKELTSRDPATLTRQEVAELHILRRRGAAAPPALNDAELGAWSRDQVSRQGPVPELPTVQSPGFAEIVESARESSRAKSLSGLGGKRPMLPPARPKDLGVTLDIPVQPLDDVQSKVSAVATSFGLLGPAAQTAGSAISDGIGAGGGTIDQMIAKVSRLSQLLNGLRMPPLGGGGGGGFDTGKQGPN